MPIPNAFAVEIDTSGFNQVLAALRDALIGQGKDVSTILVDEQRRLTRTIVNFTPPLPKTNAQWIGEQAVRKDLESLITEASPKLIDEMSSKYGTSNVDTYRTNKEGVSTHLLWDRIVTAESELPEIHAKYRNSRGRIPRQRNLGKGIWSARVVVPFGMRDRYIQKIQSHVGRWKAKWAYGAMQLATYTGERYPAWIARHFNYAAGKAHFAASLDGENPSIAFGGRGPNFAKDKAKISAAVKFRMQVIMRRIRLVVSGYSKDVAQGIRVQAKAKKQQQTEPLEDVN